MATWQLDLAEPPTESRALHLWVQHGAGRILFEDVRGYARERLDEGLSAEARAAALKAIDDTMYGLMMVIDGVTGTIPGDGRALSLRAVVRLEQDDRDPRLYELDLFEGDGMCMGYHGWLEDDYGTTPVVTRS